MIKYLLNPVLFLWFTCSFAFGQNSELNEIRLKYQQWLVDDGVDYSNPDAMIRYNFVLAGYNGANNLSAYDFNNPGAPWDMTSSQDKSAMTNLASKLIELTQLYKIEGPSGSPNVHFQDATLLSTIFSIFDYLLAKGIDGNTFYGNYYDASSQTYGLGSTAILRCASYANAVLIMRDELLNTGRLNDHLEALDNISYVWSPENTSYTFTNPGTNADGVKSIGEIRLAYILCQEDTAVDRLQDMDHYVLFLNNALKFSNGWSDFIKPDYMTYHHTGAYPSNYGATAILAASILQWILNDSNYELSQESSDNIRGVIMAYSEFTHGYSMSSSITGRFPNNTNYLIPLTYSFALSYLCDPIQNVSCGQEFTRLYHLDSTLIANGLIKKRGVEVSLYHTMGGISLMQDVLSQNLIPNAVAVGSFAFPYAGLCTYKSTDYMVSVKGTSKHIWHYEGTNTLNALGAYSSSGNIEIYVGNDPEPRTESGLTWDGWDWSMRPGSTVAHLSNSELLAITSSNDDRWTNHQDYLVTGTFEKNKGVFGMKYEDINSTTLMNVKKSHFFIDDYIISFTSDIQNPDNVHEYRSTLFQTVLEDSAEVTYFEQDSISGLGFNYAGQGGIAFSDAADNAYYVHQMNPSDTLHVMRSEESSISQNGSTQNSGNIIKSWVSHGPNPTNTQLVYATHVNAGENGVISFPQDFTSNFDVVTISDSIHVIKYLDSLWMLNSFYGGSLGVDILESVDHPVALCLKKRPDQRVKIGLTDPNLGLLDDGEATPYTGLYYFQYFTEPQNHIVKLTVEGIWEIDSSSTNVSASIIGSNTELSFATKNGFSEDVILVDPSVFAGMETNSTIGFNAWPNPSQGQISISGELIAQARMINVLDLNGRVLISQQGDGKSIQELLLSNLSSGIYMLQVVASDGVYNKKIMLKG